MHSGPIILSSLASGVTGYLLGRRQSRGRTWRKLLNGNDKWMTKEEQRTVSTLVDLGKGSLFNLWPPPGAKDAEKRKFLQAAARDLSSTGKEAEAARLAVLQPPQAPKRPHKLEELFGSAREDDYYWLRDDKREAADVIAHLTAENQFTKAVLADTEQLQEQLYQEMRSRIKEEDVSVPVREGGYYYYTRTLEGQQYAVHCRRKVPAGAGPPTESETMDENVAEEVILDENKRKQEGGHTFYMVGDVETSPNHHLLAWAEDTVGGEKYTIHVKDLATGKEVMAPIPNTSGDLMWANDNTTLFYIVKDHLDRPYKVFRHDIHAPPDSEDVLVYEEKDESFYLGIARSRSEKVLFIHSGSAVTSETWFVSADQPDNPWQVVQPRVTDVEYSVKHRGSHFFLVYRDQERPNSELRLVPMHDTQNPKVLLPHRRDVKLEGISLSESYLAVMERRDALQQCVVYSLPPLDQPLEELGEGDTLKFDEPAYSLGVGGSGDFESKVLRLYYTSLTTPGSVIDHNMETGKRAVKKVQPVLGGFDQSKYVTRRTWTKSHDGVEVPISIVYRPDLVKLDGTDSCLLDGYGSYEICNDPTFSSSRLSLLDRGWIYAIAHVRGGGEMGRYWYEDGKLLKKKNTFLDFIAAAESLVSQKFTSPPRLCISGRSAGGLLMGAVTNMRPDLFNAVIMGVGFVDALTTMLDETIPLTIIEWEEWGNPKTSEETYQYMNSYSPVDNVKEQPYPHILATCGLHDPRVGYWEPAKLVAKIREKRTNNNLLLLKCDMGAGHFSVTGRFDRLKEVALEYAFLMKCQNMKSS